MATKVHRHRQEPADRIGLAIPADHLRLAQPRVDPFVAAVGPGLAFPDRGDLLQSVDQPATRLKRFVAVRAAHGDHHADLAQVKMADPVDDGKRR